MKYFIANWKANKTEPEIRDWFTIFSSILNSDKQLQHKIYNGLVNIIICPAFPFLYLTKSLADKASILIHVGCQTVSCVETGSYTGEVTAKMLHGVVDYAIIGHSERREHFYEDDDTLIKQVLLAKKYRIEPIFCLRDGNDQIPKEVKIIAYEPPSAIGTGKNEEAGQVINFKKNLNLSPEVKFIYGGSVNTDNSYSYLKENEVDGLLVGSSSLSADSFLKIVNLT